jgi:hypothetical protein
VTPRARRERCERRVGIRACRAVVDNDLGSLVLRALTLFLGVGGFFALTGLGAELLLLGGARVSLSSSERGCRRCDVALDGAGGRSVSGLVMFCAHVSRTFVCGVDWAGGAGVEPLGVADNFRLRDTWSGVDSSFGRKSSRYSSRMGESGPSGPSIDCRILGCLFRILTGPRIDLSAAGVCWVRNREVTEDVSPSGVDLALGGGAATAAALNGSAGCEIERRSTALRPPFLTDAVGFRASSACADTLGVCAGDTCCRVLVGDLWAAT